MAILITRTAWTDDDGTGTTGTIVNNAEKTTLYNQIDEAIANVRDVVTTTSTGSQNNFALGTNAVEAYLRANNATTLTFTGIAGGEEGRQLVVETIAAGSVVFKHEDVNSTAANRILTPTGGDFTLPANARALLVYDTVSSRWRVQAASPTTDAALITTGLLPAARTNAVVTTTSTGTQSDFTLGSTATIVVLRCNNASAVTFSGFAGGSAGRVVVIENVGSSTVKVTNEDAGSTAANRLLTSSTQGQIIGAGGRLIACYEDTSNRWRVSVVDPGAPIAFTPTWTSTGTAPSIGNGTLTGKYVQHGKKCWAEFTMLAGSTTTFGTGSYAWALPLTANAAIRGTFNGEVLDSGTGFFVASGRIVTTTTVEAFTPQSTTANVGQTTPMTWATNDRITMSGEFEVA